MDEAADVRQSALALLGDLSRVGCKSPKFICQHNFLPC
jgi:hypothetical protein